jgi:hypothetical protein
VVGAAPAIFNDPIAAGGNSGVVAITDQRHLVIVTRGVRLAVICYHVVYRSVQIIRRPKADQQRSATLQVGLHGGGVVRETDRNRRALPNAAFPTGGQRPIRTDAGVGVVGLIGTFRFGNDAVRGGILQNGRAPASAGAAHVGARLPADLLFGKVGVIRWIVAGQLVFCLKGGAGRKIPTGSAKLAFDRSVPVVTVDGSPIETIGVDNLC